MAIGKPSDGHEGPQWRGADDRGGLSPGDPEKVLVVSSGVHGIEGFFGSAVQIALLERASNAASSSINILFLHGLNPFGFARLRRFDQDNVDLNRNFLLPGEPFDGASEVYAKLDRFLNPSSPPPYWEPFILKALGPIARFGMRALQQAVAGGQYRFPKGLFFGGKEPSQTQRWLAQRMPNWLEASQSVVHLDFHTGLGAHGSAKLLFDYPLPKRHRDWLNQWYGSDCIAECDSNDAAYTARGGFGRWAVNQRYAANYVFACAEFGTYPRSKCLRDCGRRIEPTIGERPSQ